MEMDKLSKEAGMTLPKGAGPLVDEAAAKLIKKHGEGALRVFTKLHFANTQKAKRIASR
jgi:ribonuclease HIII